MNARKLLGYFQGRVDNWDAADQHSLENALPENRRFSYKVLEIINTVADIDSFMELRPLYGSGIITGFLRIEGRPMGILANDCRVQAGAIDAAAAEKAARFLQLCNAWDIPLLSLCDTPDYTVAWPQGEFGAMGLEGAVHLGFKKELAAEKDNASRQVLFDSLLEKLYAQGTAVEAAAFVEIDAVIDPRETRQVILGALPASSTKRQRHARHFIDVW